LYLLPLIMAITTAVRLWRVAPAAPVEAAGTR
jgi:hypothetical protein